MAKKDTSAMEQASDAVEKVAQNDTNAIDQATDALEKVAGVAERVGIPATTFALGSLAVIGSGIWPNVPVVLPWLGTGLVIVSLVAYLWMHARSTIRVHSPPPPVSTEIRVQLEWLRKQVEDATVWGKGSSRR